MAKSRKSKSKVSKARGKKSKELARPLEAWAETDKEIDKLAEMVRKEMADAVIHDDRIGDDRIESKYSGRQVGSFSGIPILVVGELDSTFPTDEEAKAGCNITIGHPGKGPCLGCKKETIAICGTCHKNYCAETRGCMQLHGMDCKGYLDA